MDLELVSFLHLVSSLSIHHRTSNSSVSRASRLSLPYLPTHSINPSSFITSLFKSSLRKFQTNHQTDNRISAVELIIPPKTPGPPAHWHEMHDETFLVTKGTVRFHVPEAPGLEPKVVDAKAGDYVVVPTRAPHTFSNETNEEARFFNTFTPVSLVFHFKF